MTLRELYDALRADWPQAEHISVYEGRSISTAHNGEDRPSASIWVWLRLLDVHLNAISDTPDNALEECKREAARKLSALDKLRLENAKAQKKIAELERENRTMKSCEEIAGVNADRRNSALREQIAELEAQLAAKEGKP